MGAGSRLLSFNGTQQEYIALLENIILLCPSCSSRLRHPTNHPVISGYKKLESSEPCTATETHVSNSNDSKRKRQLQFVQVDAAQIGQHDPLNLKHSGPRRKRTSEPGWKNVANRMLDEVPTVDHWHQTIKHYSLSELLKDVVKRHEIASRFSMGAGVQVDQGELRMSIFVPCSILNSPNKSNKPTNRPRLSSRIATSC